MLITRVFGAYGSWERSQKTRPTFFASVAAFWLGTIAICRGKYQAVVAYRDSLTVIGKPQAAKRPAARVTEAFLSRPIFCSIRTAPATATPWENSDRYATGASDTRHATGKLF